MCRSAQKNTAVINKEGLESYAVDHAAFDFCEGQVSRQDDSGNTKPSEEPGAGGIG
jgi:hypothetical protein